MLAAGLTHQSKVAAYLYNCPEYLETYVAAFKGGFAPVNTNYRYGHDEIVYLFDNADAEAVVFHAAFIELVETVRHELPQGASLVLRRRRHRARARVGRRLRVGRHHQPSPGPFVGRGVAAATTCCCSTPAAPPACPRA